MDGLSDNTSNLDNINSKDLELVSLLPSTSNTASSVSPVKKVLILDHVAMAKAAKPKYGVCFTLQQRMKQYFRYILAFIVIFTIGYFGISFFELSPQHVSLGLAKDRSQNYRVKVLPASLSDEQLNALPKETFSYLAMIDAGSSGCRAHVYRYGKLGSVDGPLYVLPQHQSKKVKPGLSSFASKPQDAGASLAGLIDFMKEQVPPSDWSVTPIWLKATAGLRMLPTEKTEDILQSVRSFLADTNNSPFLFRHSWAKVIPGIEEGGFGWIAFNYLKKIIGPKKSPTANIAPYAVIEMGGASAQVSQLAPSEKDAHEIPQEYRFSFTIEGEEYHLYTHSYLGYGAEQARIQFSKILQIGNTPNTTTGSKDPCLNSGFTAARRLLVDEPRRRLQEVGINWTNATMGINIQLKEAIASCARSVSSLFSVAILEAIGKKMATPEAIPPVVPPATTATTKPNLRKIAESACPNQGPYSFNCVYQPNFVATSQNILAFENFFYMSSSLGVKAVGSSNSNQTTTATTFPLTTTPNLMRQASDEFCALDWNYVAANYPKDGQPKDVNNKNCFLSAFSFSFLVDGLKIPAEKAITVQKEVEGNEIEWALGAAYKEAADFLKRTNLRPT